MIPVLLLTPLILCPLLFWRRDKHLNSLCVFGYAVLHLIGTLLLAGSPQSWTVYFRVDSLNIIFLLILSVVNFCVGLYNLEHLYRSDIKAKQHTNKSLFFILFVLTMTGALLSTNLGLLWVFIEATTLATAYLIDFERTEASLEAAWKYIFICSIGITLAFVGIIFLSLGTGSLNSLFLNDLYKNAGWFSSFWLKLSIPFVLVGFGTKMGLAPMHAWLPDAHSESPSPVSALLSGTLLNTAFFAILRVFRIYELAGVAQYARPLLLVMGLFSLLVCAVYVLKVKNYKRLLAYSSVENMGIIAIGLGLGGLAHLAVLLHLIGHSLIKAAFFLTSGNIYALLHTKQIEGVTGLLRRDAGSAWLWLLSALGISAFPPFLTFTSELLLLQVMLQTKAYMLFLAVAGILTVILYGVILAVLKMCSGAPTPAQAGDAHEQTGLLLYIAPGLLLLLAGVLGLHLPQGLFVLLKQAAAVL